MYHLPGTQEVVAQLQNQILELQGELKELKTCNEQLHQKLILAETMEDGRPTPDKMLLNAQSPVGAAYQDSPGEQKGIKTTSVWRDKEMDSDQQTSYEIGQNSTPASLHMHASTDERLLCLQMVRGYSDICPPDDLAILPSCKENPEDVLSPTSVATCLSSKSQPSFKVSVMGTDQSESIDNSNETEYLKQKIHDLETELEGYQNFIFQLQKHSQCSEAIITVLCGTEGTQDGLSKPKGGSDEEEMTFSSLHQVRYVKHMKILHPLAPEMMDGRTPETLKRQLEEQEYELQKDQNLNMEILSEIHNLQNKFRDLSPSRYIPPLPSPHLSLLSPRIATRYNSLVQSQARELSFRRQQIKDGHGICVISRQHMNTMIKAFEELLQASDVDCCVAEGFQEQLNQCAELLEKLEKLYLGEKMDLFQNLLYEAFHNLEGAFASSPPSGDDDDNDGVEGETLRNGSSGSLSQTKGTHTVKFVREELKNRKSAGVEMNTHTQNELMERALASLQRVGRELSELMGGHLLSELLIEEDNLTYQHLLPESPEPSASHALSDYETSEKSFFSQDQKQDNEMEKTSVMVNSFSQDSVEDVMYQWLLSIYVTCSQLGVCDLDKPARKVAVKL
ncbi:CDK5 regulatory subunit associated protein 2 [Saguinus oedipus]|uniref:CDK5 regulatory subunit associated protein 2 n=2 Tax=Saguinus TaxID=9486 RepID=A0ABQ9WF51_SAGOE|nr:CDK5 regulatory subunit associated protein 2 [Saguinus oedipus]